MIGVDVRFGNGLFDGILLDVRLNGIERCCVTNGFAEGSVEFVDGDVR